MDQIKTFLLSVIFYLHMQTIGKILKEKRLKTGFSYDQVEKTTKIRKKFIIALEEDDYKKLPVSPYIEGFIKNYCDFLGLRTETILALFRRQNILKKKLVKTQVEEPLMQSGWQLTPNKAIFWASMVFVIILFGYFYFQYRSLHTPPPLYLENPKTDLITKDSKIAIFGNTDSDATLFINNEPGLVKEDGKFFKEIDLNLGNNTFVIESISRVGKKTTKVIKVTRTAN